MRKISYHSHRAIFYYGYSTYILLEKDGKLNMSMIDELPVVTNEVAVISAPSITVIIPLYNKVKEIARSLNSILNQTITDYELLIIDGGSTDGSLDVVSTYLIDTRIHLIHQQSKGLPAARNEAILQSHGDLIAFLDADDEWHPDFLETIVDLYHKYPGAGIYATAYERGAITTCKPSPLKGLEKPWEGYLKSYFHVYVESGYPPFCPCSVALNKDVFSKVGYFNPESRMSEDLEMWVKVAYNCPIVFTTEIHARYHLYADNKMSLDYYPIDDLPSTKYLESLPREDILKRDDAQDILYAIEYMKLIAAYFNIGAGNHIFAKRLLKESHSQRFVIRRTGLKVLTICPSSIGKWIIFVYSSYKYYWDKLRSKRFL